MRDATQQGAQDANRRTMRARKVSQRMAVVTDNDREQVTAARLATLENDNTAAETYAEDSDDEYVAEVSEAEEPHFGAKSALKRKRKKVNGKRRTRGMLAERQRGPRTFMAILEEADPDSLTADGPNYVSAAMGPPTIAAPRNFCSVCGNISPYKCTRCGSRFCSRRCQGVHVETRCLKFTV